MLVFSIQCLAAFHLFSTVHIVFTALVARVVYKKDIYGSGHDYLMGVSATILLVFGLPTI